LLALHFEAAKAFPLQTLEQLLEFNQLQPKQASIKSRQDCQSIVRLLNRYLKQHQQTPKAQEVFEPSVNEETKEASNLTVCSVPK
jgi:hypothetical protein